MAKLLKQEEIYCRLLDSAGNALTSTDGALDSNTAVSFPSSMAVTHDALDEMEITGGRLKVLANIQVGGNDPSSVNPLIVGTDGATIPVTNTNLDALTVAGGNLLVRSESNLYVDGDPVSNSNKIPVSDGGSSLTVDHAALDAMTVTGGKLLVQADVVSSTGIDITAMPEVGTHGNCFASATSTTSDTSTAIDCRYCSTISVFGSVFGTGSSTMKLQFSQDGTQFNDAGLSVAGISNQDFCMSSNAVGARYVRVVHTGAADLTLTCTLAGK